MFFDVCWLLMIFATGILQQLLAVLATGFLSFFCSRIDVDGMGFVI